jgi:hypothetical protein
MDVGKRHYNPRYHSEAFRRTIVASLFFTRPVSLRPTATAICLRMDRICTRYDNPNTNCFTEVRDGLG